MARGIWIAAVLATTAACTGSAPDEATRLAGNDLTPPGVADSGHSVDPMIVGDRLLRSGEAELALRAYSRAGQDRGFTPEVMLAVASANLALGRLNQAERQLREIIEAEPSNQGAWNNLGVVLMERQEFGEAKRVFERAFALDSGQSPEIRENLRIALAKMEKPEYNDDQTAFTLVRAGQGVFHLTRSP